MIGQQRPELELDSRIGDEWRTELLGGAGAKLELSDFGFSCRLGDLYKNTPVA